MNNLLENFEEYYNEELTKRGWITNYEDEQYILTPIAADGPNGSIWGYLKVVDGELRVILLQKITPIEDFGGIATCPCRVEFRVFVAEPKLLEDLLL